MQQNNIRCLSGSVLIYTIVLVNIVLIMSIVILNNTGLLQNIYNYREREKELLNDIKTKSDLAIKYTNYLNSNGSGYVDNISCPTAITMSGRTLSGIVSSATVYMSGKIVCNALYNSNLLTLRFNSGFTNFDLAFYNGTNTTLSGKIGLFPDADATWIKFPSYTNTGDYIDDNFNSDNYKIGSTGPYLYPSAYQDDDTDARKTIYGYAVPNTGFHNIFWNNTKIQQYILKNGNNADGVNALLGTGSVYLNLDADRDFKMKIVQFNKSTYNSSKELVVASESQSNTLSGSVGYIQNSLTLSGNLTGNEYTFDTLNNDYGIFIQNDGTGVLLYKLTAKTLSGSDVYINPINDTSASTLSILGYDIIKNGGKYIPKMLEIVGNKKQSSVDLTGILDTYDAALYGSSLYH